MNLSSLFKLKKKKMSGTTKVEDASSPYMNAKQVWFERYGSYIQQAAQWRFIGVIVIVALILSLLLNIAQLSQQKVVPYVVQIDRLGKTQVDRLEGQIVDVPKEFIQSEIAGFIQNWRTVTADFDLQGKMINKLSAYTVGTAKGQIREWFTKNSPYNIAKDGKLVQIAVKGLPLPVSKDSWRIEWLETIRNQSGMLLSSQTYEATVRILIKPPKDEVQILLNPVGLMVTEVSYAKVFNAQ